MVYEGTLINRKHYLCLYTFMTFPPPYKIPAHVIDAAYVWINISRKRPFGSENIDIVMILCYDIVVL